MKIHTGDKVKIISGKDRGKVGTVLKVLKRRNRIIVEGVNMVSKHKKPSATNPQGGIEKIEAPIHISNLMLFEGDKTVKVGYKFEDGKKIRFSKKSNKSI